MTTTLATTITTTNHQAKRSEKVFSQSGSPPVPTLPGPCPGGGTAPPHPPHHHRHYQPGCETRLATSRLCPHPSTRVPTIAGACRGGSTGGPGRRAPSRTSRTPPCSCWGRAAVEQGVQMQAYTHPIHSLPGRGIGSLPRARCHGAHGPPWCQHSPPPFSVQSLFCDTEQTQAPRHRVNPHTPHSTPLLATPYDAWVY